MGDTQPGGASYLGVVFGIPPEPPRARSGRIEYDGQDITGVPTHEIARLRIAQSPEGRRIFPRMSVTENLQMGADATDSSEADRASGLERVFALFPRLKERMTQRGGTLSGGEQQMLAIGRALMSRPRLLMLDEPSLGLAPLIARQIFDWEQPRRQEAYPEIKARVGMPQVPRIVITAGVIALLAIALFFLPEILNIGGTGAPPAASASPSAAAQESIVPTEQPAPTPKVYTIKKGDTLLKVARANGLTLEELLTANPTIKNPNKVSEGQQIVIPVPSASDDGGGASAAPSRKP